MSHAKSWWYEKANAIARSMVGYNMHSVALLLAIACHETACGDAWPGDHNWGATTRRGLSQADRDALSAAGLVGSTGPGGVIPPGVRGPVLQPKLARLSSEAAASDAIRAAGIFPTDAAIHVDSRPPGIVYFTWFAAFPSDEEGAAYFVSFFRTAAEKQGITDANTVEEATAMYAAHYYTGVHAGDPSANIQDYVRGIAPLFNEAVAALKDWTPGSEYTPIVGSVEWVQERLNALGVTAPPLVEDGIFGPKTAAAIKAFQSNEGLAVTGTITADVVNSLLS